MMSRVSLATILVALVAVPVSAQTLAEAAAEAKKVKHEWPVSNNPGAPTTPVITNADLDTRAAPVPPPLSAFTEAMQELNAVDAAAAAAPVAAGPTATQLHELNLTAARKALREAKAALREGEASQRQGQRTYDNTCSNPSGSAQIRVCADMHYSLRYSGPESLRRLRTTISDLETLAR